MWLCSSVLCNVSVNMYFHFWVAKVTCCGFFPWGSHMCLRVCVQAHRLYDSYLSLSAEPWNQIQLCGWIGVPSPWALTSLRCYSKIIHQGRLVRKKHRWFFFSPCLILLRVQNCMEWKLKAKKMTARPYSFKWTLLKSEESQAWDGQRNLRHWNETDEAAAGDKKKTL